MKHVLDSSVALKWALPEPDTAKALKLRADYRNGIHDLISPDFFPLEAAHALTRAERQRRISPGAGWGKRLLSVRCPEDWANRGANVRKGRSPRRASPKKRRTSPKKRMSEVDPKNWTA